MPYQVGADLGATYTAAAVSVVGRAGPPEIVPLALRSPFVPSVVFADLDGTLLVGEPAEQRALTDPSRLARQFKRRIGDGTPLHIGGVAVAAEELAARVVAHVLEIVSTRLGSGADRVAVTHPAGWGPHRLMSLRAALTGHGLSSALLLSEPQAAVIAYASREPLEPGAAVAVYDLGGGGFTAAVVRKAAADQLVLVGQPEELELSSLDLDEVVFDHVRSAVGPAWDALDPTDPDVLAAVARLRRGCVEAKEALSADTEVMVPVLLPGVDTQVRLGRAEFEEMIRPAVAETVEALHRALASAGTSPDELAAVLLVGGSARIPLITQEVSAQLGRPVSVSMDPKGIIAMGAALAARGPEPEPATGTLPLPVGSVPVGEEGDAPPWTRPVLPVGPPSTRTGDSWRRLVRPVATTAALIALLFAGGMAVANRDSSGDGSDRTTVPPTTTPSTTAPSTIVPPTTVPPTTAPPTGAPPTGRLPATVSRTTSPPTTSPPTTVPRTASPPTSSPATASRTTSRPTTSRPATSPATPIPPPTTTPPATTPLRITPPPTTSSPTAASTGSTTPGASQAAGATTVRTP